MIRVEEIQGNLLRGYVPATGAEMDELCLTRWDAQKRRLRKRTTGGRDVAISLARPGALADGDVLHADPDVTIIATVEAGDVLVLTLDPTVPPAQLALNALRLGHVLGNQHWPLRIHEPDEAAGAITDGGADASTGTTPEIVVPLSLDRRVVDAVVRSHRLEGVSYTFRAASPGEILDEAPLPPAHLNDHAYTAGHSHAHGEHADHEH